MALQCYLLSLIEPFGGARRPSYAGLTFMEDLLADLERRGVAEGLGLLNPKPILCVAPGGPSYADLAFMEDLLADLEKKGVAAPAPIEQRWTATSGSPMSPASAPGAPDTVHSWVGIIMYLPTEDAGQRAAITDSCATVPPVLCIVILHEMQMCEVMTNKSLL